MLAHFWASLLLSLSIFLTNQSVRLSQLINQLGIKLTTLVFAILFDCFAHILREANLALVHLFCLFHLTLHLCPTVRNTLSVTPCVIAVNPTVGHNLHIVNFVERVITMSREDPQLRIRLPIELKEKIEIASKANNRSMNAEIVSILSEAISREAQTRNSMVVILGRDLLNKYPEVREAFYNLVTAMAGAGNDKD